MRYQNPNINILQPPRVNFPRMLPCSCIPSVVWVCSLPELSKIFVLEIMNFVENIELIKQGAEAKLYKGMYLGKNVIIKERFKKKYRHPILDENIGKERLKAEARGIMRCKVAGILTPTVYLIDPVKRCIVMEFLSGITVKDFVNNSLASSNEQSKNSLSQLTGKIGENLAKMHRENIIHGDLTTSNMIVNGKDIYFIDFGLSFVGNSTEDKGVDLYVLERAILSTHPTASEIFQSIVDSYKKIYPKEAVDILIKYEEVKARGRKRTMVG
ncbi:TP53 regulating kinase isoform X2 [Rhodnius prolixus]